MKIYNINIYYIIILIIIILLLIGILLFINIYINRSVYNYYFIKTNPIWYENLNNTTWISDNSRSEKYVFYTDSEGNKKCVHQLDVGSGLFVFITNYPEFKILGANKFKIGEDIYEFKEDKLISKNKTLTFFDKKTIIYDNKNGNIDIKDLENNDKKIKFGGKFEVYLVDKSYSQPYKFNDSQWKDFLEKSKLKTLLFTGNDIEEYNWATQIITLNKDISKKFIKDKSEYTKLLNKRSNSGDDKSGRDEELFNELKSFGDTILHEGNYFIVTLEGKKLYGGRITSLPSSMVINYPVIYSDYEKDSKIKIMLRPYHTGSYDYSEVKENIGKKIEFQEIKDYLKGQMKLSDEFIGTFLESSGGYAVVDNVYIRDFKEKGYEKYLNKKVKVFGKILISLGYKGEYGYINELMNIIENPKISLVPDYELKFANNSDKEFEKKEKKMLELGKKAIIQKFGQEAFDTQTPFKAEINNNEWYIHGTVYKNINGKNTKMGYSERGGGNLTVEFTKDLKVSKVYYSR